MVVKPQYKLEGFEGPLDILLLLIAKHKLDIYDISISELLAQYLAQIDLMRRENMDVASEFLEMAARLVHIKSVSLLPKQEEAEELKLELTGQLIEYQQCKKTAEKLSGIITFDRLVRQPASVPPDEEYKGRHDPRELLSALLMAAGKGKRLLPPRPESFSALVSRRVVSVTSQVVSILRGLWKRTSMPYKKIFSERTDRSERVAAFLAILELIKGRRVRIEGEGDDSEIRLMRGGEKH